MTRLNAANMAYTTLAAAINDEVTTLALADATGFPVAPFMITIGDEIIEVRSRTTTTCSDLIRGAEGTVAAAHSQGDSIEHRWTAGTLNRIWNDNDVVLGAGASLDGLNAVVVGRDALAGNLGAGTGDNHIAIGHGATTRVNSASNLNNMVAIGQGATATATNDFILGNTDHIVKIPGSMTMTSNTTLDAPKVRNIWITSIQPSSPLTGDVWVEI